MLRTIKFYLPIVIIVVLLSVVCLYFQTLSDFNCTIIMGYSSSLWGLMVFCFGLPGLIATSSGYLAFAGYHSLKEGVYPPSNIPPLGMKVRSGKVAKAQALLAVSFPLWALAIVALGFYAFSQVVGEGGIRKAQEKLSSGCVQHVTITSRPTAGTTRFLRYSLSLKQ